MVENDRNKVTPALLHLVDDLQKMFEEPELLRKLVDNESASLNTDEIIEGHARRLGTDPEELRKLLKKPQ